jgi:hypothetical protein
MVLSTAPTLRRSEVMALAKTLGTAKAPSPLEDVGTLCRAMGRFRADVGVQARCCRALVYVCETSYCCCCCCC